MDRIIKKYWKYALGVTFLIVAISTFIFFSNKISMNEAAIKKSDRNIVRSNSAWLWKSAPTITEPQMIEVFQFCQENNISTLYLTIDDYLLINNEINAAKQETRQLEYNSAVSHFISSASKFDINVQALVGEIYWANPPHDNIPDVFLDYVFEYNNTHESNSQFSGIQYDVEFYTLPDFYDKQQEYSMNFLNMVESLVTKVRFENLNQNNFKLGFAVPFWFGSEGVIDEVLLNGDTKPLAYRVLDLLNTQPGSYLAIMDYRNYATGIDGSIEHAEDEIVYAQKYASATDIIIGQDLTNSEPARTTFYGLTKKYFVGEISKIHDRFKYSEVYSGIGIHDIASYMILK